MVFKKLKYSYNFLKVIQFSSLGAVFYFNTVGLMDLFNDKDTTNLLTAILFLIGAIITGVVSSILKSYSTSKHISYVLTESNVHFKNLKVHKDDLFTYELVNSETEEVLDQKTISILYKNGEMYFIELEESKSPASVLTRDLEVKKGSVSVNPLTEKVSLTILSEESYNEMFPKTEVETKNEDEPNPLGEEYLVEETSIVLENTEEISTEDDKKEGRE